jgi:hypothetical protein
MRHGIYTQLHDREKTECIVESRSKAIYFPELKSRRFKSERRVSSNYQAHPLPR